MQTPMPGESGELRLLPPTIGVIVVDGFPVVGAALTLLIEAEPDLKVLASASSARETLDAVRRLSRRSGVVVRGASSGIFKKLRLRASVYAVAMPIESKRTGSGVPVIALTGRLVFGRA